MPPTDYLRETHHEFLDASNQALANAKLQSLLGRIGDNLGEKNRAAWAALPNADALRAKARAIKDATLTELDTHLETLEASVIARGGQVHWAADGAAACEAIVDIIRQYGATKVVKSKSMTSEEIHLNDELQSAGIEPIETDLGEFIVQLLRHRPSHIVGPALHLSRTEVAATLSQHAGRELPDAPHELAAYAREKLREEFATAEVGITGVNFAIAETGTIALVTNEGNARLTTALPKVHIALMGIEKVIPRMADLPVFLKVLARAATGQKLSIYTTLCTTTAAPDELDGPEQFHLVILDNGRSEILGGPLRESLFCIRCGACLNACPIYRNVGGHAYGGVYSGPIGAVLTPLYDGLEGNQHLPHASSLCGACQAACPVKIAIPEMLVTLREQLHHLPRRGSWIESLAYRLWARTLRSPRWYSWATWLTSRLGARLGGKTGWLRRLPGGLGGWTATRDFPAPPAQRFRDWWKEDQNLKH